MFQKFLDQSDDNDVIASIKDELKSLFYKNRNHVIKNVKLAKSKQLKQITNTITKVVEVEKKPKKVQKNKA